MYLIVPVRTSCPQAVQIPLQHMYLEGGGGGADGLTDGQIGEFPYPPSTFVDGDKNWTNLNKITGRY